MASYTTLKGINYTESLENDCFVILQYMNLQYITDLSMALSFSSGSHKLRNRF